MDIKILGSIEVWHDHRQIFFARQQQRLILGILALSVNKLVLSDRIIDLVWGDRSPAKARAIVQSRISEIRARLKSADDCRLDTYNGGYILRTATENIDAHRFLQMAADAREIEAPERARTVLRAALQLWRGPVLGGWTPDDSSMAAVGRPRIGKDRRGRGAFRCRTRTRTPP